MKPLRRVQAVRLNSGMQGERETETKARAPLTLWQVQLITSAVMMMSEPGITISTTDRGKVDDTVAPGDGTSQIGFCSWR